MGRTVSELRATLQVEEMVAWMAFDTLSPLSDERMDINFANLCVTMCNAQGAKKRSGAPFVLEDFLLFREKPSDAKPLAFMRGRVSPTRIVKGKFKRNKGKKT